MFVGHYAVALVIKKIEPKLNVGWIFFSVMLLDALLGVFVLLGIEKIIIPVNYEDIHYLAFEFPFSHGLMVALFWSALVFFVIWVLWKERVAAVKVAGLMAIAVFSHFLIDGIVHMEMPIIGENSAKIGFGLWNNLYIALGLEVLIVLFGLVIYFTAKSDSSLRAKVGMPLLLALLMFLTIGGQVFAPAPQDIVGPASTWIAGAFIFALIAYWLDQDVENRR